MQIDASGSRCCGHAAVGCQIIRIDAYRSGNRSAESCFVAFSIIPELDDVFFLQNHLVSLCFKVTAIVFQSFSHKNNHWISILVDYNQFLHHCLMVISYMMLNSVKLRIFFMVQYRKIPGKFIVRRHQWWGRPPFLRSDFHGSKPSVAAMVEIQWLYSAMVVEPDL